LTLRWRLYSQRFLSLDLVERIRHGVGDPGGGEPYKTKRVFFDFVVGGISLYVGGISLYEVAAQSRDLVSVIWTEPLVPSERTKAIQRLLASEPGDASDGRISLYICPECGDLGCGAITVRIDKNSDSIVWRDFGFENNHQRDVE
jgi:hypothetical protein